MENGHLYLLPTPMGDGSDLINRSVKEALKLIEADYYFVESIKVSAKLIKKMTGEEPDQMKLRVLNKNTIRREMDDHIKVLSGRSNILMSDGGMPAVSDPGRKLVREAHRQNVAVRPLYATSSITSALACSGLNGEKFTYLGYPPRDKAKRVQFIKDIEADSISTGATQVMIEAPYRNIHLWKDMLNFCSDDTQMSLSVELFTKDSLVKTATISNWKKMKWPLLKNKRVVFLINGKNENKY